MYKNLHFFLLIILYVFSIETASAQDEAASAQEDEFNLLFAPKPGSEEEKTLIDFVKGNAPDEMAFVAVQRLAEHSLMAKNWDASAKIFEQYKPLFPDMGARFDTIIKNIKAPLENLELVNLGKSINTKAGEYHPTPSADGGLLYFVGYKRGRGAKGEDVFVSEYDYVKQSWKKATKLDEPINTPKNEAINSISPDGSLMILFGNYKGSIEGDIFYSEKDYLGWGRVNRLPYPINTQDFEGDGQLTSDQQTLLFVSDRDLGTGEYHKKGDIFHGDRDGNTDIYVVVKDEYGIWDDPINVGEVINTPFTERSPFLHPDGKTLYFCSDGHAGFGRADMYVSRRLKEDSWTEWSPPVNLGKEINSPGKEYSFKVTTDDNYCFISKGASPEVLDIYMTNLPEVALAGKVAKLYVHVLDKGGNPIGANFQLKDLVNMRSAGAYKSNPQDGNVFIPLQYGKRYGYYVHKRNYRMHRRATAINLIDNDGEIEYVRHDTVLMVPYITDLNLEIGNILFESGSHKIDPRSFPELARIAQILVELPFLQLEIGAHTDSVGSDKYNQSLSQRRAKSVVGFVASKGVKKGNLVGAGYGEERPLAPNSTEEGRALNRRVECTVQGEFDESDDDVELVDDIDNYEYSDVYIPDVEDEEDEDEEEEEEEEDEEEE